MCAMMQKLRVNSMPMKAPLSEYGCGRSIGMPRGLSQPTHSVKVGGMTKPEQTTGQFSTDIAASPQLTGAPQFRRQETQNDPVRTAMMIGLGIALLVFLGSMIAVLTMHAPA